MRIILLVLGLLTLNELGGKLLTQNRGGKSAKDTNETENSVLAITRLSTNQNKYGDYHHRGSCKDTWSVRRCKRRAVKRDFCDESWAKRLCKKTCGHCGGTGHTCSTDRDCVNGRECGRSIDCDSEEERCCHHDEQNHNYNTNGNLEKVCRENGMSHYGEDYNKIKTSGDYIINGDPVHITTLLPWQVMILYKNGKDPPSFVCGGSLISTQWVLTAAHCIYKDDLILSVDNIIVQMGFVNRTDDGKTTRKIILIETHKGYNPIANYNDIALLKMEYKVQITKSVRPVALPKGPTNYAGVMALISGWGWTGFNRKYNNASDILMKYSYNVITTEQCRSQWPKNIINDLNLCAMNMDIKKDPWNLLTIGGHCYGDSGGPLVTQLTNGEVVQIGVVSYSRGDGVTSFELGCLPPYVYTNVSMYIDWICETVDKNKK